MRLSQCPTDFFSNCHNYLIKCKHCPAGSNSNQRSPLLYFPIDLCLPPHPFSPLPKPKKPTVDKVISQRVKKALKSERQTAHRLNKELNNAVKLTQGSGRINHDGDLSLFNDIRVEHKSRKAGTSSFTVTSAEYLKGKQQNINVWCINVIDGSTTYFLDEETFLNLISLANLNLS